MSANQRKLVSFLKKTKASAEGHLSAKRQKFARNTPSPFSKRQAKQQTEARTANRSQQQSSKKYFIPISQKMRSKVSHSNLYKSHQQKILTFDGLEKANQQQRQYIRKEGRERIYEIRNQTNLKRQVVSPLEVRMQKTDEKSHKMQTKGQQMQLKSSKLSEKLSKNVVSILKIPSINPPDVNNNRNFHSLYQIQDYVSKLSVSPKIQNANQETQTDKQQAYLMNKKCSIIPALHLSTHYKPKRSPQRQKPAQTLYDFALIKKVRKEIENCLVVQSKQEKIISNLTNKTAKMYKLKVNERDPLQIKIIKPKKHQSQVNHQLFCNVDQFINNGNNQSIRSDRVEQSISHHHGSEKVKNLSNIAHFLGNSVEKGVYEKKISSYRQFLFMVNFAHRIFDPLNIIDPAFLSKTEKSAINKYYYYVGQGNNAMLVRSLMKRRIWWEQTFNVAQAHFVWTQIKIQHLIQSQPQCTQQILAQDAEKVQIVHQKHKLAEKVEKMQKNLLKLNKKDQYLTIQKIATLQRLEPYAGKDSKSSTLLKPNMPKGLMYKAPFAVKYQQKLLTKNDFLLYRSILTPFNGSGYQNFETRVKNLSKGFLKSRSSQAVKVNNHFEGNHSLGNKKALLHHLLFYYKINNMPDDTAFPKTYHIKQIENDPQFKMFFEQYKRIEASSSVKNIWILKPGQNSNRGKGITVVRDLKDIKQQIRPKEKHKNGQNFTYILQKYIQKPLLYKGRKFDIRHYMVITRLYGKMRAYWYGQGYVRTSSSHFQLENIRDPMIHLTNDAIQKNGQDYGYYQDGNKVSYNQLQKYFSKYQPQRQFQFNKIYQQMRTLCIDAVKSTFVSLDPKKRLHNFQVFGLDFMIDEQMKVYLIEINTNPCLQLSSNLLARVIPSMLQQSFRLALDPLFPPSVHYTNNTRYLAPDCTLQKFQFELIFDESRDGPALKKLYQQNIEGYNQMMTNLVGSEKQQDDVYENEGEEIEIDKII